MAGKRREACCHFQKHGNEIMQLKSEIGGGKDDHVEKDQVKTYAKGAAP